MTRAASRAEPSHAEALRNWQRTPAVPAALKPAPTAGWDPKRWDDTARRIKEGAKTDWNLERFIGARGFAVVGAMIVIVGIGLFLKLAYDKGWLEMPPQFKCLGVAGFGLLLLGLGELVRRKINAMASAGISAAGIGSLYAAAYVSYAVYNLVSAPVSFVLMGLAAAVGITVATQARLALVAGVSLVGGYAAPILIGEQDPSSVALPIYLCALLSVGLALSFRMGHKLPSFRWMRSISWWGTMLLGGAWCVSKGEAHWLATSLMLAFVWAAVHAELLGSARREDAKLGDQRERDEDESRYGGSWSSMGNLPVNASRPLMSSLSTSAWSAGFGAFVFRQKFAGLEWIPPATGMVACLATAQSFTGHLRLLLDRPKTWTERQGAVLLLQSGALLIAAVALGLSGWVQLAAWLAMGVASAAVGRWIGSRAVEVYGLVVLAVAAVRAVVIEGLLGASNTVVGTLWDLNVTHWTVLIALSGAAWIITARVLVVRHGPKPRPMAITAAWVGALLMALAPRLSGEPSKMVTLLWLIGFAGLGEWSRWEKRLSLGGLGLTGLGATVGMWFVAFVVPGWSATTEAPGMMHQGLWIAAGIAASVIVTARRALACSKAENPTIWSVRIASYVGAGLLAFGASSAEIARTAERVLTDATSRGAAVSVYWGVVAVGMLAWGFRRKLPALRYTGLGIMGAAALKAVVLDLANVGQAWRIVSFVALGLLMLGVAAGYAKLAEAIDGAGNQRGDSVPPV